MGVIHLHEDPASLARAATERIVMQAEAAVAIRGAFVLGLSGGRTETEVYRALAQDRRIEWTRVRIVFADERGVPPDHPDSNYARTLAALIEPAGIPPENVRRMKGEYQDLEAAAAEYEPHVSAPVDLVTLGIGADGHTASIFPRSPLVMERVRRVAAVYDSPKPPPRRITVTPRVIREASAVMVFAAGEEKARAVARSLEGRTDMREVPARMLREYEWHLDRAAASALGRPDPTRTA
jgi:6-phosphogluconolactonase